MDENVLLPFRRDEKRYMIRISVDGAGIAFFQRHLIHWSASAEQSVQHLLLNKC